MPAGHPVYPSHLVQRPHLRHGGPVLIRPVRPDDADLVQALVLSLSAASRYRRFLHAMNELPAGLLASFVDIDYRRQMTLVATLGERGRETAIGMAQYVAEADTDGCDFALLVQDGSQRRGLGSILLDSLALAAGAAGYAYMAGDVLAGNEAMLTMAGARGFSIKHCTGGLMRIRAALAACVTVHGGLPVAA